MNNRHIKKQGILLVVVLLLQVLFFRYFNFKGYSYCFFYASVLFLYPNNDAITNMILGFLVGVFIDVFEDTLGMHAAVCVLLMYLKPKLLSLFGLWELDEEYAWINPYMMGVASFFLYLLAGVFIFVLSFSMLEAFHSGLLLRALGQTVLSTLLTMFFLVVGHYLLFDKISK